MAGIRNDKDYKYYNPERKEKFAAEYKKSTNKDLRKIFEKTYVAETYYNKDISKFTLSEIEILFTEWDYIEFYNCRLFLEAYIDVYKPPNWINPLSKKVLKQKYGTIKKWESQFKKSKPYINMSELLTLENGSKNKQDAVIFRLAFLGFTAQEMLKLTLNNVSQTSIHLDNKVIEIDKYSRELLIEAQKQDVYLTYEKDEVLRTGKEMSYFIA